MAPSSTHVHQGQPVLKDGADLDSAAAAAILLHGRGASARGMLTLARQIDLDGVAYFAPQATQRSWYPNSFLAPLEQNEPALGSALQVITDTLETVASAGLGAERTLLLGFSQGACLATEYAARHPQRYGGVVGLSGGLIGPEDDPLDHEGSLDGSPVFLGCSDQDPYIPLERVHQTASVLEAMDASVTTQIYEGMGHTTNDDEIEHARTLLAQSVDAAEVRDPDRE